MARYDNQLFMNNGYPIFKWAPGVPILDNDEDDDKIVHAIEQVAYGVHAEPDNEYDKDNEDTGEDEECDGHGDGDDNKDSEAFLSNSLH